MAAPKGNQYGKDSETSGRPSRFDLEEEAKAFMEWADRSDSLVLRKFAAIRGYFSQSKLHEYADQSDAFRKAFNYARVVIGARREELLMKGKGNPAPFNRYAALYDMELKAHEKEIRESNKATNEPVDCNVRGSVPTEPQAS